MLTVVTIATFLLPNTLIVAKADETKESETFTEVENYSLEELNLLEKLEKEVKAFEEDTSILDGKALMVDKADRTRAQLGKWSWRDGVIALTDGGKKLLFVNSWHAAIVVPQYYYTVAEAGPDNGVFLTHSTKDKNEFLARYPKNQVWQVGVTSTSIEQDWVAGEWAGRQVGKPYNSEILKDIRRTDKFYCSSLIWAAYYYTTNYDLDLPDNNNNNNRVWRIHPKEILDHPGTTITYRKR